MAVKWGVIGCGGIAYRRTIPGMMEASNLELIAVMDLDKEAVDKVAAEFNVPKKYYTEAELLADGEIEAVYIGSPVFAHKQQVLDAAKTGKHILCEKPLGMNVEEALEMVEACKSAGVYLTEGYMMRFHSLHQKAREIVKSGGIGKIVMARAQLSCWYPDMPGVWRQDPKLGGGGSFIDMGTHLCDLLEYILGDTIAEVSAFNSTQAFKYPVEDSSTTLLMFQGGTHGIVDAFFCIPDAAPQEVLEIYGTQGSILSKFTIGQMPGGEMVAYMIPEGLDYDADQSKESANVECRKITAEPVNMYAAETEYLSDCILNRKPPEINTGEDAVHIAEITTAVYESARSKKVVTI